jgi:tripartite-type tricarboxylate transporter receptor subunit TctC
MRTFLLTALALLATSALGQTRIIVPFPPGGGADALARIMSPKLSELWREQVVVENRPGASGHIGADFVAQSAADGKTHLMSSTASLTERNVHQFAPVFPHRRTSSPLPENRTSAPLAS